MVICLKDHLESVPPFLAHNAQGLTKGDLMILVMILVLMILVMMLVIL